MKITFLGTGSAWPIPRIGCECPQCASARGGDARDVRTRSAALLEARPGGPLVLVDAGPDIYRQLAPLGRAGVARIEALVLTHVHPDHFLGLVDLAAALPRAIPLYHLEDNLPAIAGSFGYLLPHGGAAPARPAGGERRTAPEMFRPRAIRFGEPFSVAGAELVAFDTHHFEEFSTAGLVASAGGRRLAYAPDFRRTEAPLEGLDLLALDASMVERSTFGHLSVREGIALARRVAPRMTLFTHVGHVKLPHATLEARVRSEGGADFAVACDGLEVEL
jgi:phosphoribosyl 1,2-cyclic phosphate phosphodiesterase